MAGNTISKLIADIEKRIRGIRFKPEHADQIHQIIEVNTEQRFDRDSAINRRILEELQENNSLLRHLIRSLTHHRILGGVMSQLDSSMTPIAPGNSPVFGVTPTPAGVVTQAANAAWTSSDPTNAPVTMDPTDPTGLTAKVDLSSGIAVGSELTLTWAYTNPSDESVTKVEATFPIVAAAPPPPTDVTGGTMEQIA